MSATVTTLTPALLQQIARQLFDSVYKYAGIVPLLPKRPGFVPGANYTWTVRIAGNSSVQKFASADPVPASGYQQTLLITGTWQNYRVIIRLEGDARRAAGGRWGELAWPGVVGGQNYEVVGGLEDLASYVAQDSLSADIHGCDGQVNDDSVNYWDRARGVYTTLQAAVVAGGGAANSVLLMNKLLATTRGAGHGGKPKLLLMGDTQDRKFADLVSGKLALQAAGDISGGGHPLFDGCLPVNVPGLAAAIVLAIDPTHWEVLNHEPENEGVDVLEFGPSSDAKVYQAVMSNMIIDHEPWRDGRLENLSTA